MQMYTQLKESAAGAGGGVSSKPFSINQLWRRPLKQTPIKLMYVRCTAQCTPYTCSVSYKCSHQFGQVIQYIDVAKLSLNIECKLYFWLRNRLSLGWITAGAHLKADIWEKAESAWKLNYGLIPPCHIISHWKTFFTSVANPKLPEL